MVRGPEGDAAPDEGVGHGRGGRVALACRLGHPGGVDRQRADQAGHDPERGLVDGDRVEQRRDALLEVALVGQRQALEQGQAAGQLPDDAGSAATDQLGRVRVLLVGHHRAAGRERVGDAHEPEPRVRPPGDLLGQPAQVDHAERDGRQGLDHEVAIRDGVERVRADAVEAELRGRGLAIERVAGARERARAQRRDVEAGARVGEAAPVALGHLDVGEQVMGEEDRLGRLDVGRARQDRRPVALGEVDKSPLEVEQRAVELVDRRGGSRAACPSRPGRCASGRCGGGRPAARPSRSGRPRRSCGRPRAPGPRTRARPRRRRRARRGRRRGSRPRRRSGGRPGRGRERGRSSRRCRRRRGRHRPRSSG